MKNRKNFKKKTSGILPILNSAYFYREKYADLQIGSILDNDSVSYDELRIGSILKVCRFIIRHITQTETQTETEANFTHIPIGSQSCRNDGW